MTDRHLAPVARQATASDTVRELRRHHEAQLAILRREIQELRLALQNSRHNHNDTKKRLADAWAVIRAAGCSPMLKKIRKQGRSV